MDKIKFFDATLRDGSHAVKHQFSNKIIERYCRYIDRAGMDAVIVLYRIEKCWRLPERPCVTQNWGFI